MPSTTYGPPMDSDTDESDYEGFYFGDTIIKKENRFVQHEISPEQQLYDAARLGDLTSLRQHVEELNWNVNMVVNNIQTLLLISCYEGHYDIVEYLVVEKRANVNKQVDSITPLLNACDCRQNNAVLVERIVRLLLEHGAVINVSDKYGTTPFMLACKNGYANVVRLMIKDVSFDAVDNNGCTPIFHAIEQNQAEVVKLLIDAGVNPTLANNKGYTPVQVAEFHGFYDLLEVLPRNTKIEYIVPTQFLSYNTLRDHIPRIFLKSDCPEYFQEINSILFSLNMHSFLEYFAQARVTLAEFLIINDEKLSILGIDYPIYRSKIMKGILDFHLHHWSKKSIARVGKDSMENFYEILMITANHLQHLVIIQASLKYIAQNANLFGDIGHMQLQQFRQSLNMYRGVLRELTKTTKYLSSFSPAQNPIYINFDEIVAERKRSKVRKYFKYTTIVLGISVFICLKFKRVF